jgi:hypothetical protein
MAAEPSRVADAPAGPPAAAATAPISAYASLDRSECGHPGADALAADAAAGAGAGGSSGQLPSLVLFGPPASAQRHATDSGRAHCSDVAVSETASPLASQEAPDSPGDSGEILATAAAPPLTPPPALSLAEPHLELPGLADVHAPLHGRVRKLRRSASALAAVKWQDRFLLLRDDTLSYYKAFQVAPESPPARRRPASPSQSLTFSDLQACACGRFNLRDVSARLLPGDCARFDVIVREHPTLHSPWHVAESETPCAQVSPGQRSERTLCFEAQSRAGAEHWVNAVARAAALAAQAVPAEAPVAPAPPVPRAVRLLCVSCTVRWLTSVAGLCEGLPCHGTDRRHSPFQGVALSLFFSRAFVADLCTSLRSAVARVQVGHRPRGDARAVGPRGPGAALPAWRGGDPRGLGQHWRADLQLGGLHHQRMVRTPVLAVHAGAARAHARSCAGTSSTPRWPSVGSMASS